ncbi:hypothetical protein DM02DRAFT_577481, partial [Periconia macrospinosa]
MEKDAKMSARSRIDHSRLPPPRTREPLHLPPRRLPRRILRHSWTDEEVNLIAYLRLYQNWSLDQIRKKHFPSSSKSAISHVLSRTSVEDRLYRASIVASMTASASSNTPNQAPTQPSSSRIGLSKLSTRSNLSTTQTSNNIETITLLSSNSEDEDSAVVDNNTASRYNLRPNRSPNFREGKPPCSIDRTRFPHFSRAYENHLKLRTVSDKDYLPPSHSPTPESSDRSPSVVSSQLSDASSLDLFGLEARPISPPEQSSSV